MPNDPYAGGSSEHVVKLFKLKQTAPTATVDFTDGDLLAAGITANTSSGYLLGSNPVIIFDQEIFNQDVYMTHKDNGATSGCNYYLELEQVTLNENQSTMATLQSLRQIAES